MPFGIIVDCASVAVGGLLGGVVKKWLPKTLCDYLSKFFGITSIVVGISLIVKTSTLAPVMLALILGAVVGEVIQLENILNQFPKRIATKSANSEFVSQFTGVMVLICSGSLGLMGAMIEGMTGDPSLLFTKAVLDFFGAAIFASTLGISIALISLPQLTIYLALFAVAGFLMPYVNEVMVADFTACGGVIALVTGLRIADIKWTRISSLLPALIFVMPISALWHMFL